MSRTQSFDPAAFRQFEHDGWTEVASHYDSSFGTLTAQAVAALLDAAGVQPGERLLDLACGTGRVAAAAVQRGAEVTGLDLTQAMVGEAAARCPAARFEVGDAQAQPFADATFDAVACGFGILHFPDAGAAVAETYRTLRAGGRFACSIWCPAERSACLALVRDALAAHGTHEVDLPAGPAPYQYGNPERLAQLLSETGFTGIHCFEVPVMVRVSEPTQVLAALTEGGVRTRKLLEAQTPEALVRIQAFAAESASHFRVGDHIEIPRPALIGVGLKA